MLEEYAVGQDDDYSEAILKAAQTELIAATGGVVAFEGLGAILKGSKALTKKAYSKMAAHEADKAVESLVSGVSKANDDVVQPPSPSTVHIVDADDVSDLGDGKQIIYTRTVTSDALDDASSMVLRVTQDSDNPLASTVTVDHTTLGKIESEEQLKVFIDGLTARNKNEIPEQLRRYEGAELELKVRENNNRILSKVSDLTGIPAEQLRLQAARRADSLTGLQVEVQTMADIATTLGTDMFNTLKALKHNDSTESLAKAALSIMRFKSGVQSLQTARAEISHGLNSFKRVSRSSGDLLDALQSMGGENGITVENLRSLQNLAESVDSPDAFLHAANSMWKDDVVRIHNSYWIRGMLTNLKTVTVDTSSTFLKAAGLPFEHALGAAGELATNKLTGGVLQVTKGDGGFFKFGFKHRPLDASEVRAHKNRVQTSAMQYSLVAGSILDSVRLLGKGLRRTTRSQETKKMMNMKDLLRHPRQTLKSLGQTIKLSTLEDVDRLSNNPDLVETFFDTIKVFTTEKPVLDPRASRFDGFVSNPLRIERDPINTLDEVLMESWNFYADIHGVGSKVLASNEELYKGVIYKSQLRAEATIKGAEQGLTGKKLAQFIADEMHKGFDELGGAVDERILENAREATFTRLPDNSTLQGSLAKSAEGFAREHPFIGRQLFTFIRTPNDIIRNVTERTLPADLVNHYATQDKDIYKALKDIMGAPGTDQRAKFLGRTMTGTTLWTVGLIGAYNGTFTGAMSADPRTKASMRAAKFRPYSFVLYKDDAHTIPDVVIEYNRTDPTALFLGLAADFRLIGQYASKGELDTVGSLMVAGISNNLTNKTYLRSLTEYADLVDNNSISRSRTKGFLERKALGYLPPNFVAGFQEDPFLRDARDFTDRLLVKYGFTTWEDPEGNTHDAVAVRRDAFGKPQLAPEGYGVHPFVNWQTDNDPVAFELSRLTALETPAIFSPPLRKQRGVDLTLYKDVRGMSAYDRILERMDTEKVGQRTLNGALLDLISSEAYQGMQFNNTEQVEGVVGRFDLIEEIRQGYEDASKAEVLFVESDTFKGPGGDTLKEALEMAESQRIFGDEGRVSRDRSSSTTGKDANESFNNFILPMLKRSQEEHRRQSDEQTLKENIR